MTIIRGKVAAFVTERQLLINRGETQKVVEGMVFAVLLTLPPVRDPDDPDTVLGQLSYEKGRVRVIRVFERMSVCDLLSKPEAGEAPKTPQEILLRWSRGQSKEFPTVSGAQMISPDDWSICVGDEILLKEDPPPY